MSHHIDHPRRHDAEEGSTPGAERFGVHTFGHFLKQERMSRGISRAVLAAKTGIDAEHLSAFESNAAVPGFSEVTRLADALGIDRSTLLREQGLLKP